jgi:hypothetical protein
MDSAHDTPKGWVAPFGHPRIKACSRLPMAFRSVPRPSSPPGAKASTECPSLAREHSSPGNVSKDTRPGPPPCTETIHREPDPASTDPIGSSPIRPTPATPGLASVPPHGRPLAQHISDPPAASASQTITRPEGQGTAQAPTHPTDRSNAPEHSPRRRWGAICIPHTTHPVRHAPTQRDKPTPNTATLRSRSPAQARLARPETHQNLIHTDKEHDSKGQSLRLPRDRVQAASRREAARRYH